MAVITDAPPAPPLELEDFWPRLPGIECVQEAEGERGLPHSPALAAARLVAILGWTLPLIPVQAVLLACRAHRASRRLARRYWRGVGRLIGLRVVVHGAPAPGPVLFATNHVSYLDIVLLGGAVEAAFISRHDIAGWPGIGLIARLGRTIFVNRERRREAGNQRDEARRRLVEEGESLILFPEGTSSDGGRVRPFRSALFAAVADAGAVTVQPVTLAYTRIDGMPLGRAWRPLVAWYGAMTLVPHAWQLLGSGPVTAELEFHPPVASAIGDRKTLAQHCHAVVAAGLARALAGRGDAP